ncbi:carbon-nitrogen hydrolase family protein [Bowmanella yangjiangensis]|uniref:Carbon-nitrogen hydrolase family protein n=1 Tax=Bowmanella yangjiangensis TaxID=2811230 RepID=A0ABS3CQC1_9ALTE|nr:carbon-nitrogen hydrolase family protein [Bowmanella yangjiangensis]MBN7819304.1 carbon-nitrogen hydrolase family protein [Bowmanella yangjiangensis]
MVNLAAIQLVSSPDPLENLTEVARQLQGLDKSSPCLIVLPECFACFGGSDKAQMDMAETLGEGPVQSALAELAIQHGVWLVAGTLPIKVPGKEKFSASSLLFAPSGEVFAHYRKIHLFDVQVADGTRTYLESRYTQPGDELVVADTPLGRIGMAVCYDLRFAGLFQAMGELDILVLPAAFTQVTGEAHWWPLLRARAIEKQCFVVAAGQGGEHANGRETYGHSTVISPWGDVLTSLAKGPGLVQARVDFDQMHEIRRNMPVGQHNQFRSKLIEFNS